MTLYLLVALVVYGANDALAERDDPGVDQARIGYSQLMEGKLATAETTFQAMVNNPNAEAATRGLEGLAVARLMQGKIEPASQHARELERKAPKRAVTHLVKASRLYQQGKKRSAQDQLAKAEQAVSDFPSQRAVIHNAKGNLYRKDISPSSP